jgi:replicative DNA helicase
LGRRGEFEEIGGEYAIRGFYEAAPHSANAVYYAQIVRQKAVSRRLIENANQIIRDGYSNNFNSDELLEKATRGIMAVGEDKSSHDLTDSGGAVTDAMYGLACRDDGISPGLTTGFADLDAMTGGLQPEKLVVVAARPSIGKSAIALNMAETIAFADAATGRAPRAVLYVSLEMSRRDIGERLVCGRARVDGFRFMHSHLLTDDERYRLKVAAEELAVAPIIIDDASGRTFQQIAATARRLKARRDIGAVFVDYLQLIRPDGDSSRKPRHEVVAEISGGFKCLAKDLGIGGSRTGRGLDPSLAPPRVL